MWGQFLPRPSVALVVIFGLESPYMTWRGRLSFQCGTLQAKNDYKCNTWSRQKLSPQFLIYKIFILILKIYKTIFTAPSLYPSYIFFSSKIARRMYPNVNTNTSWRARKVFFSSTLLFFFFLNFILGAHFVPELPLLS